MSTSVEIAILNKVKRKMIYTDTKFCSIFDYIIFIMEIVEEYTFLNSEEKEKFTINVARRITSMDISEHDDMFIKSLLAAITSATKGQVHINKPKRCWFFMSCLVKK